MREHIKRAGAAKIILTSLFVIFLIIIIESFAAYNILVLHLADGDGAILKDTFSILAIAVAASTIIAKTVFTRWKDKHAAEFHYYFRIRPMLLYSAVAVLGDMAAISFVQKTSYIYIVFFTSLIAINIFATGFAIYSAEKAIKKEF